jgi:ATP-dependent helicase/nuclease subunit A
MERLLKSLQQKRLPSIPAKVSVTSLLPPGVWEDNRIKLNRPKFMGNKETLSSAEKGTAFHRFMELLPLNREWSKAELVKYRNSLEEAGVLTASAADGVEIDAVYAFLHSSYGAELKTAPEVRKELSFVGGFEADELFPEMQGKKNQKVILQGAIDLLYRRDHGEWVLLDYKTNDLSRCETADFLAKYGRQMELYSAALKRIYNIDVAERVFYLTKTKRFVSYENE